MLIKFPGPWKALLDHEPCKVVLVDLSGLKAIP
jgi:hypothetical protein